MCLYFTSYHTTHWLQCPALLTHRNRKALLQLCSKRLCTSLLDAAHRTSEKSVPSLYCITAHPLCTNVAICPQALTRLAILSTPAANKSLGELRSPQVRMRVSDIYSNTKHNYRVLFLCQISGLQSDCDNCNRERRTISEISVYNIQGDKLSVT